MSRECVCKGVVAFVPLNNPEKVNFFFAGTFQQFWQKLIVFYLFESQSLQLGSTAKKDGLWLEGLSGGVRVCLT